MTAASNYKESFLWLRHLAPQKGKDAFADARTRLRVSYEQMRTSVSPLVAKIAHELPALTVHDISHLDAMWNVADKLLGDKYPMNPAEVYVLGLAFLLHDTATSSFAFENGIAGVKKTEEWGDFVAQKGYIESDLTGNSKKYQITLFETLRMLHANRAEDLLTQKFKAMDGSDLYLLEDVGLRNHYGKLGGKIASSHGEDPSIVEARWSHSAPVSPHSSLGLPASADWSVNCLKIAMLLRCIDAAHIDSLRAPDMLAALTAPDGESKEHWFFQNKLGSIAINSKNELYWSGSVFDQNNSDAWWRCFETCCMVDREVKTANRILVDHGINSLKACGVMGAQDIAMFQKNVPVEGWQPVNFTFQVSRVGNVIEKFGGASLYGNQPRWALRELLQNGADAIRALRVHCEKPEHGRIEVTLRQDGEHWWLDILDDGIGMSRYVLTEVLLDFGRSLWKDAALRYQWKGLSSKGFTSVGQFGIGFFSVFMLGDEVKLTTWAYGSSIDSQLTLHLRNRVTERPILLTPSSDERLKESGTRVSVRLRTGKSSLLRQFDEYDSKIKKIKVEETLSELVGGLVPTLDVNVVTKDGYFHGVTVSANDWLTIDPAVLLRRLYRTNEKDIKRRAKTLANIIEDNGVIVGRACLDPDRYIYTFSNPCTLTFSGIYSGMCTGISGVLLSKNNVDLARTQSSPIASADALARWASGQVFHPENALDAMLSARGISLGVADRSMIVGTMGSKAISVNEIIKYLDNDNVDEIVFITRAPECPNDMSQASFETLEIGSSIVDISECGPINRFDFKLPDWIAEVFPEGNIVPRTVFEFLKMSILDAYPNIVFDMRGRIIGKVNGDNFPASCAVFSKNDLSAGDEPDITDFF